MDTMRVLVLWLTRAWGLGAVRMVAARTPSPSSPALAGRSTSGCQRRSIVCLQTSPEIRLLGDPRLNCRRLSLSTSSGRPMGTVLDGVALGPTRHDLQGGLPIHAYAHARPYPAGQVGQ